MKSQVFQTIKSPRLNISKEIKIVNDKNQVLSTFANDLDLIPETHEHLRDGNYLIINNPGFDIIFSGKYINQWVEKRRQLLLSRMVKKDSMINKKLKS